MPLSVDDVELALQTISHSLPRLESDNDVGAIARDTDKAKRGAKFKCPNVGAVPAGGIGNRWIIERATRAALVGPQSACRSKA